VKFKKVIKNVLLEPKHWIGWALTVGVLFGVFYLLPVSVMQSYLQIILITFAVVVSVDLLKHFVGLQ